MRDVVKARAGLTRLRFTPVTLLVTAAVLFAAGGVAYGTTSGNSKQSGFNGPAASSTSGPFASTAGKPVIVAVAVVKANGSLARGFGVQSSSEVVPGGYQVLLKRKVTRCAFEATLGTPTTGTIPRGQIGVANRSGHKNGVAVETFDSTGAPTPLPFHLEVIC